jgi:predicted dehydrogenase
VEVSAGTLKRVALVGLGSIGRRHLRLLKALRPDVEVVLVRSGRGRRWPEESLSKEFVNSIDEAIARGIDAAIISSPAPYHVKQAIQFIKEGIPLLIEKPLSHNMDDIQELKDASDRILIPILVGYVLRHSTDLRYFGDMLSKSAVGRMIGVTIDCRSYLPNWRPEQDYRMTASAREDLGGGALLELSHELDYANWLFGPFKSVEATLLNSGILDIDVEDTADLTLTSKSGLKISMHLDFCRSDAIRQCTLEGSEGRLSWDGIEHSVRLQRESGETGFWAFTFERDAMFREQLKHFLSCIEDGDLSKVNLDDGIAVMTLIEAARRSSRENAVVYL